MVESKKTKVEPNSVEDVEMKSVESPAVDEAAKKVDRENFVFEELRENAKQIEKGVSAKEQRFILRILRSLSATRKNVSANILRRVINIYYNSVPAQRDALLAFIEEPMETGNETKVQKAKFTVTSLLPEHDVYFHLLVILYLLDLHDYKSVSKLVRTSVCLISISLILGIKLFGCFDGKDL